MLLCSPVAPKPRIMTPTFAVLSAVTICFFLSNNVLIPVLPRYLKKSGLPPYQLGLVIGAVSFSAIAARLAIGREVDRRGRKRFIILGVAVGATACLGYPFVSGLPALIALRLYHGVSIASFYPAATALIADITPPARRGEALSYFSMLLYAGFALGPAIGEALVSNTGFTAAFLAAAWIAAAGLVTALFLREPPRVAASGVRTPLVHRAAAFPALVLGLGAISFAALGTFVPLYTSSRGGGDSRYFFFALSITIIALRSFAGRIADRIGPGSLVVPGAFMCAVGVFTIATSAHPVVLVAGAVGFGIGWGALFPGLLNFTIDRVKAEERGSAMGTFTAAFDLTFGASQPLLGAVLQISSYRWVFLTGGLAAISSGLSFIFGRRRSNAVFPALEAEA